jgi:UTP--glucose-1-phosphate uridylyltransferase
MSNHQEIVRAVIPAAGFGTRMLPASKAVPKEMLPVAGKPLIQYAVEEAVASGIHTVILVVRNRKSLIRAHFAHNPELESFLEERQITAAAGLARQLARLADLRYVEQERPLGLAHAICCARPLLREEPFVVLLPDVIMVNNEPVTRQLIRTHERLGGSVVAIREVEPSAVQRHGIVQVERRPTGFPSGKAARVIRLVEKPSAAQAPSRLGVFGRYLLEPAIWDFIAQTVSDAHGEVQLTDALNLFCQTGFLSGLCFEGEHYDAGDPLGYLQANLELALRDPHLRQPLVNYLRHLHGKVEGCLTLNHEQPLEQQESSVASPE